MEADAPEYYAKVRALNEKAKSDLWSTRNELLEKLSGKFAGDVIKELPEQRAALRAKPNATPEEEEELAQEAVKIHEGRGEQGRSIRSAYASRPRRDA